MDHKDLLWSEIDWNIKKLDFKDRRVFIFGVNDYSSHIIHQLRKLGITVEKILDNDTEKEGTCVEEIEVVSPEEYLCPIISNALILIASQHVEEMSKQLEMYGYTKENVVSILDTKRIKIKIKIKKKIRNRTFKRLCSILDNARIGEQIIQKIKKRYGENVYILFFPVDGMGDMYLPCIYLKAFLRNNGIEKYVFLIHRCSASRLLRHIGLSDVIELNRLEEKDSVLTYLKLIDFKDNVIPMLDVWHTQIGTNLILYQKINLLDYFRILLDVSKNEEKCFPKFHYSIDDVKETIQYYNIEKNNSVILAPYANSAELLDFELWENLSKRLLNRGYKVYTNVSKDSEKAISGTEPIFFHMEIAQLILEEAGCFVGLRSGFCDVVCSAECKKIVLYPAIDDFYVTDGLQRMGIGRNIYNIKCNDGDNYEELLERVEKLIVG